MMHTLPIPLKARESSHSPDSGERETQAPQAPTGRSGMIVADRYHMIRQLGDGGMGSVWLAHDIRLDTPCALKLINTDIASRDDIRARFEREAKAAAQLRSSHVVQTLDYGTWNGMQYIAMELLEGETLEDRLFRLGRLSAGETVAIATQIAKALTKAHASGLIHRDLKPSNIFLVSEGDYEIVKVLDFGIAKSPTPIISSLITKAGALMGTPQYMSPEQAQGLATIDYRADLWALAVIIFRCITGYLPFDSEALGELLIQVIVHPIPTPSSIAPAVPTTFDVWWARAAVRDRTQRFQSAKELTDALAAALGVSAPSYPSMGAAPYVRSGAQAAPSPVMPLPITPPTPPSPIAALLLPPPILAPARLSDGGRAAMHEGMGAAGPEPGNDVRPRHPGRPGSGLLRDVGTVLAIVIAGALATLWSTTLIERAMTKSPLGEPQGSITLTAP